MSEFYTRVWQDGFNDGIKAGKKNKAAAVKPGDIEKAIAGLKGIGEAKLKAIMQQLPDLCRHLHCYATVSKKKGLI